MGVILLELFQPFGTEMERTEVLTCLRNGQIPHTFYKKWPIQAKYVKLLTSQSATERPTAAQLRESELFHTTEHVSYGNNLNLYGIKKYKKKMAFVFLYYRGFWFVCTLRALCDQDFSNYGIYATVLMFLVSLQ